MSSSKVCEAIYYYFIQLIYGHYKKNNYLCSQIIIIKLITNQNYEKERIFIDGTVRPFKRLFHFLFQR